MNAATDPDATAWAILVDGVLADFAASALTRARIWADLELSDGYWAAKRQHDGGAGDRACDAAVRRAVLDIGHRAISKPGVLDAGA